MLSVVGQDTEDLDAVSHRPTAPEWARHITRLLFHERACGAAGAGWRASCRPPKVSSHDVVPVGAMKKVLLAS
jgi:hypothetical protein